MFSQKFNFVKKTLKGKKKYKQKKWKKDEFVNGGMKHSPFSFLFFENNFII